MKKQNRKLIFDDDDLIIRKEKEEERLGQKHKFKNYYCEYENNVKNTDIQKNNCDFKLNFEEFQYDNLNIESVNKNALDIYSYSLNNKDNDFISKLERSLNIDKKWNQLSLFLFEITKIYSENVDSLYESVRQLYISIDYYWSIKNQYKQIYDKKSNVYSDVFENKKLKKKKFLNFKNSICFEHFVSNFNEKILNAYFFLTMNRHFMFIERLVDEYLDIVDVDYQSLIFSSIQKEFININYGISHEIESNVKNKENDINRLEKYSLNKSKNCFTSKNLKLTLTNLLLYSNYIDTFLDDINSLRRKHNIINMKNFNEEKFIDIKDLSCIKTKNQNNNENSKFNELKEYMNDSTNQFHDYSRNFRMQENDTFLKEENIQIKSYENSYSNLSKMKQDIKYSKNRIRQNLGNEIDILSSNAYNKDKEKASSSILHSFFINLSTVDNTLLPIENNNFKDDMDYENLITQLTINESIIYDNNTNINKLNQIMNESRNFDSISDSNFNSLNFKNIFQKNEIEENSDNFYGNSFNKDSNFDVYHSSYKIINNEKLNNLRTEISSFTKTNLSSSINKSGLFTLSKKLKLRSKISKIKTMNRFTKTYILEEKESPISKDKDKESKSSGRKKRSINSKSINSVKSIIKIKTQLETLMNPVINNMINTINETLIVNNSNLQSCLNNIFTGTGQNSIRDYNSNFNYPIGNANFNLKNSQFLSQFNNDKYINKNYGKSFSETKQESKVYIDIALKKNICSHDLNILINDNINSFFKENKTFKLKSHQSKNNTSLIIDNYLINDNNVDGNNYNYNYNNNKISLNELTRIIIDKERNKINFYRFCEMKGLEHYLTDKELFERLKIKTFYWLLFNVNNFDLEFDNC